MSKPVHRTFLLNASACGMKNGLFSCLLTGKNKSNVMSLAGQREGRLSLLHLLCIHVLTALYLFKFTVQ